MQPLGNVNIDQFNTRVRNGQYQAPTSVTGPYSRALSFVNCAGGSIKSREILATSFGSAEESKLIDQTVRRNLRCNEGAGGVPVFLMRAAMSEGALKSKKVLPGDGSGLSGAEPGIDPAISPMLGDAIRLASCQVKRDAGAARAVLATGLASAEEKAAEERLAAATPQCGVREQTAGLDSVTHRAMIASALGAHAASGVSSKN
ncbi:hypothetical protein [Sphingomonas sp. Leaf33]|uniref:hypothetical protein n=1 Tax=Sphingomonas sp. Leaf33 TaxID=1736215 RepID=UPI0012E248D1|nr:hypothetical protein [Sphingomonas sp. Leaf33]